MKKQYTLVRLSTDKLTYCIGFTSRDKAIRAAIGLCWPAASLRQRLIDGQTVIGASGRVTITLISIP